ncbi:hypothetical protein [Deinococcus petrolearius]|uniref:Uncharacterized protein n=1 Tax=Deinococcus petrolearius TaxID=1751295 RepID=A0ABW1DMH5_9DEIO
MAVNDDVGGYLIPGSHAYAELLVMFAEMALLHSGGTAATLEERKRRLQEVIAQYPAQVSPNVQGLHRTRRRPQ